MSAALQTTLLLIVILVGTVLSTAAWEWPGSWSYLATYGGALVAGLACGRIVRIVRQASA